MCRVFYFGILYTAILSMKFFQFLIITVYICIAVATVSFCVGGLVYTRPKQQPIQILQTPAATSTSHTITEDRLANSYVFTGSSVVRLTDGHYYTGLSCEKASSRTAKAQTMSTDCSVNDVVYEDTEIGLDGGGMIIYGDIDGDGAQDAIAQIYQRGGGSGTFYSAEVYLNKNGNPVPAGIIHLGDRESLESGRIEKGMIYLTHSYHLPQDAACCPSALETLVYQWKDGNLKEISHKVVQEVGDVSDLP